MTSALKVSVQCRRCGERQTIECHHAMCHPFPSEVEAGWDGIVLSSIVRCARCGAEDDYELEATSLLALKARAGLFDPTKPIPRGTVGRAAAGLWDGSMMTRPTRGIARLRQIAERDPENGEAWRRLGNLCELYERWPEAESAWRKAVEVDSAEVEAAMSLATRFWDTERDEEGARYLHEVMTRLPRAKIAPQMRRLIAANLVRVLSEMPGVVGDRVALALAWHAGETDGEPIVSISSVNLQNIRRWERLEELLAGEGIVQMSLSGEPPADEPTILQQVLSGDLPLPSEADMPLSAGGAALSLPLSSVGARPRKPPAKWVSPSKKRHRRTR